VEILNQLGDLFLAAVPTVILVFLFYLFLRWSFFGPMERVLSERHKRVAGALQEAEASRVAVQEKLRAYNEALRKVRGRNFCRAGSGPPESVGGTPGCREQRPTVSPRNRSCRARRRRSPADVEAARASLEQSSVVLAGEIAENLLAGGPSGPGGTRARGGSMKSWRRAKPVFASGLLIFFLTALPVLAAEGGEDQGGPPAHSFSDGSISFLSLAGSGT